MKEKLSKEERLNHIIEAIDRIFRFVEDMDYEEFLRSEMAQYAVIKNFEIIGEAAYQLPNEYRKENEDKIEWRKIMGLRHVLVHDYYKINKEIIWITIQERLLELREAIIELIEKEKHLIE